MTNDQEFTLAILGLVLPVVASILTYRKTAQTHEAVNGMQVQKVKDAEVAAVGAERQRIVDLPSPLPARAEQNAPGNPPGRPGMGP